MWRRRIESEIKMCDKAWELFDKATILQEEAERELALDSRDPVKQENYNALRANRYQAYQAADRVSIVLENLVEEFRRLLE